MIRITLGQTEKYYRLIDDNSPTPANESEWESKLVEELNISRLSFQSDIVSQRVSLNWFPEDLTYIVSETNEVLMCDNLKLQETSAGNASYTIDLLSIENEDMCLKCKYRKCNYKDDVCNSCFPDFKNFEEN